MPVGPRVNTMANMKRAVSRGMAAIAELCALGLQAEALVPAVLEALHQVVPSSRNLFDWADASGRLVHYYFEGPIDATIAQLYFDEFHNRREAEAMPAFDALAQRPMGIHSAAELNHAEFFNSALYHEIWRPQGLKYRVEAVLRGQGGALIGSLVLYRGPGEPCFKPEEERRLAQVLPVFAQGLASSAVVEPKTHHVPSPEPSESLILDLQGSVHYATPGVHRLLLLALGGIGQSSVSQPLDWLARQTLSPLLQRLREQTSAGAGHGAPLPRWQWPTSELNFANAWGRFAIQARLLQATGQGAPSLVQADIHRHEPYSVALARKLRSLPLTPGQAAVCSALVQGKSQAQIADQLGVAPATVVDHVRKSYLALDVRTVLELRALLDGTPLR